MKSVSRNYCLPQNEYDKRIVLQNIYELCEEVGIKLRRLKKKARTAGVYLRGEHTLGGNFSHDYYFASGSEIFNVCHLIISHNAENFNRSYIRQISVWAGNLKNENELTLPLLESERRKEKLLQITDAINNQFGDHTIRNGFLLYADKLTTVPNGYMADRYERSILPEDPSVKLPEDPLKHEPYLE